MSDALDHSIQENAKAPRKATSDGVTVEQHPLADQIAADKHLASKRAAGARGLPIPRAKISPGGTA